MKESKRRAFNKMYLYILAYVAFIMIVAAVVFGDTFISWNNLLLSKDYSRTWITVLAL